MSETNTEWYNIILSITLLTSSKFGLNHKSNASYKHQDLQELIQMNAPLFSAYLSLPNVHLTLPCYGSVPIPFNIDYINIDYINIDNHKHPNKTSYYSQYNIIFPKKNNTKNTPSQILSYSFCFARKEIPKIKLYISNYTADSS